MFEWRIFKIFEWIVVVLIATQGFPAFACPDGQYESCLLGECVCLPKVAGNIDIEHGAEQLKNEIINRAGVPALEAWIIRSRNTAIVGSQPIPPQIRQALSGYIEQDVMNRARFKIGDKGILNLAGLTIEYGDRINGREISAVTLIDVIVFRNASDAYNNPSLWAHELTHVKQFRDWGTRDFSILYIRDENSVEYSAYAVGNGYDSCKAG